MTQKQTTDKEAIKEAQKAKEAADLAYETEKNKDRTGVGTRLTVGYTRGRSTQRIEYESFDTDQPATLPADLAEFMKLTKTVDDEKSILAWVIDGFNSAMYANASDPISEFMNPAWPDETKNRFKLSVRNFVAGSDLTNEQAAEMVKGPFEAAYQKQLIAAKEAETAKVGKGKK